jgi:hypothetical protein
MVAALASGEQVLILRKGGIAEGRDGFQVKADRFWLLPTFFHTQREKLKSTAEKWLGADSLAGASPDRFSVSCFAEISAHRFINDWAKVEQLDAFHFWSQSTLRERFDWSKPPGLHAFIVRVQRLNEPFSVSATPELAGCKSWVELPQDFDSLAHAPALSDAAFQKRSDAVQAIW